MDMEPETRKAITEENSDDYDLPTEGISVIRYCPMKYECPKKWETLQSTELKPRACMTEKDEAWCERGFWAGIGQGCVESSSARA